ncbi:MAG: FecR domain-containing protein [Acinetobacter populi]|jgi:transmembrane sensor|uniref:FecR family protein n=1 Tax=Acinetobacter populi TaxID=1582270 RepID=UPI0023543175|nr:FecR domain-containing protein [Acinetobacter populi]MCH4248508.1 FecR domain-containing protein [Acinetobacter populi]
MQHSNQQHSSTSSDTELMEQVAEWLLKMDSAECTEQDRKDFQHWQQQNPKHAEMVQQMQATFQQFNPLRQQTLSHQIVEQAVQQTREDEVFKPYKLLSIIFLVCLLGSFWYVSFTQHWFADQRNDYMSWNEQVLPDQSEIRISGQTAYNIKYNQQQRLIELLDGNILVDVAKDSTRPFMIQTHFAKIRALGIRFIVQHHDRATILTMLHSTTEVTATLADGQLQRRQVHAGQQVIIDAQGIHAVRDISIEMAETAWQKHMLAIDLMPLDQVLAILQSYDDRHFKYDAQALNDIEVTAMLPLDGSGLDLLQQSLAITVTQDVLGRTIISKK